MKRSISRGLYFVALALALTALAYLAARTIPGAIQSVTHAQSQSKEAMLDRLRELGLAVANLKQQVAKNPKDESVRSQLEATIQEYDRLSGEMGGDRAPNDDRAPRWPSPSVPEVVPPSPPGCTATTTTFSQSTPTPIPDNNPTGATSTIAVAGAGTYVWDVNVTVNITHTFAADLDFTLTSPSGTVVTLSTDNGGGNDNVFNGTTFDDQANPGSPIPYVGQPNQTVDNTYANLTVAASLTPEEPLAAFNGSDPNGTWTLKVVDDLGGDSGTINSWSMEITTFPAAPTAVVGTVIQVTPVPIPDNNPTGATSTIVIGGFGTAICDVNATVNITHTFAADLDFTLTSPSGKIVTLSTDNGGGNDNVFNGTTFDDQANPGSPIPYGAQPNQAVDNTYANNVVAVSLTPEEPLALFNGDDPNGTWTLKVVDDLGGDSGTINAWSLTITTCSCAAVAPCVITCPPNQTRNNDPNQCGAVVVYPAPTSSGTCGTITCTPPSGTFFPVGTTTVTCQAAGGGGGAPNGAQATIVVPDDKASSAIGATITGDKPATSNSGSGTAKSPSSPLSPFAVLYDQNNNAAPTPGGVTSQNFEAVNDAFDSECADDFVVPAGEQWTIQQVFVVGEYSIAGPAASANVVFYADSSTLPGAVAATAANSTISTDVAGDFTITLSSPAVLAPGTYWVSVQANMNFTPTGQWFWDNRSVIANSGAAWRNPGAGFGVGCTSFGRKTTCLPTQNGPDQLFQILGTSAPIGGGGGPTCTFTVTVNDTQPPVITCSCNLTAVTPTPGDPCVVVNFTTIASDNCPGVTLVCNPPSGSCFPVGVTTVTCTATDASGNTATCTFTVSVFNGRLQDDFESCNNTVLFNTLTGDYRWCCHGTIFTGRGKITRGGDFIRLEHIAVDRRVRIDLSAGSFPPSGNAALQSPPGTVRCVIQDRDIRNDSCVCGGAPCNGGNSKN
jgi:subtilisin-like proprotein convertase family protein